MVSKYLLRLGLAGIVLVAVGSSDVRAQAPDGGGPPGGGFPGGGRGGRGMRMDPGARFDQLANGRPSVAIAEIAGSARFPGMQERLQQWATQNGVTNGQMTRDQYMAFSEQMRAEFRANFAGNRNPRGGFPGGPPGAPPADGSGAPPVQPPGGVPGGAAPVPGGIPEAAPNLPGEPEEESRPMVHRPGKLPKGLPEWFGKLDTDGDGQIGLYEWKEGGRALDEFRKIDRNGDGFITVDEAMRSAKNSTATVSGPGGDAGRTGDGSAEESSSSRIQTASASPPPGSDRPSRRSGGYGRFNNGNRRNNRPPAPSQGGNPPGQANGGSQRGSGGDDN